MHFRQSLFWDTDPARIDPERNARYIIERVLEFGHPDEVAWVFKQYPKSMIEKIMDAPRSQVSLKSRALWTLLL